MTKPTKPTTPKDDFAKGMDAAFDVIRRWQPIEVADEDDMLCAEPVEDPAGVFKVCTRPATHYKVCDSCNVTDYACDVHAVDDVNELDLARFKKQLLPLVVQYAAEAGSFDQHLREIEAQRAQAFRRLGDQIFAAVRQLDNKGTLTKAIQLDDHQVNIVVAGKSVLNFPRSQVHGDTPTEVLQMFCRVAVGMLNGAGNGITSELNRLNYRDAIMIQCDDFEPAGPEHHALAGKHLDQASGALPGYKLAALNEALRACARPARAFRMRDSAEGYAEESAVDDEGPVA